MNNKASLHQLIIHEILAKFSKKVDAVEKLMTILSVNKDGVYRRLRGATIFTVNEVQILDP